MTTLTEYLAAPGTFRPFDWADNNCCRFAARWVALREGNDPMGGLAATRSALEALRLVKSLGGTLTMAWSRQLGRAPISPRQAQVGDVVIGPIGDGSVGGAAGICAGTHAVFAGAEGEAIFVAMNECTHAWRIA